MKILTILLTVCLSCCLAKLSRQQLDLINKFTKTCFKELNIPRDSDLLAQALKSKMKVISEQEIDYLACLGRQVGVINTEGIYRAQELEDFFFQSGTFNQQDVKDVVEYCISQQKQGTLSYRDNVAKFNKCFFKNKKFDFV